MIKVWGRARGLCVKKVLWCLDELDLEFERVDAGKQYGVTDTEEYLKMNRNGLVPTLKDGDYILWESNAIMRYLAMQYGDKKLYSLTPREHGDVNRWLDWQNGALWPDISAAFIQLIRTPEEKRNHELLNNCAKNLAKNWGILDEYLEGKQFITGDNFTIADIALGVMAQTWVFLDIKDKPSYKNFNNWYQKLEQRRGFQRYAMLAPEPDPRQKKELEAVTQ
jgi:glutathione S-transferase